MIGCRYILCPNCGKKTLIGIGDGSIISLFDMRLKKGDFKKVAKPRMCRVCKDIYIVSNVLCDEACGKRGIAINAPAGRYVCPSCDSPKGQKTLFN